MVRIDRGFLSVISPLPGSGGYSNTMMIIIVAVAFNFVLGCEAHHHKHYSCDIDNPSPCRKLVNITFPFRLKDDPPHCGGDPQYELSCENNRTVLNLNPGKYYVESISYENQSMRVVDSGFQIHNCSSLPFYSFPSSDYIYAPGPFYDWRRNYIVLMSCESPIITTLFTAKSPHFIMNTAPCINGSSWGSHSYVLLGDYKLQMSDVPDSCTIVTMVPIQLKYEVRHYRSFSDIHHELAMGFDLIWRFYGNISIGPMILGLLIYIGQILVAFIVVIRTPLGYLCLSAWLIYMLRRRHFSMDTTIEEFLQRHNNLLLIQYSYSDIKKMTKHFKTKLGEGGFGSVYKGKLRSGNLVAIKMLVKSKGNGQDFINEVATIGRIHHVNVVQLIGFCFEGSKRALVYEFMPNGSLDKCIFTQEQTGISLSWESMYKIALGVAHGIEYLRRGCDMQILHFDIKPHNVLLDEDFTPKISDFGLAKLYPTTDNTVSLTAARGTIGYIAPELVYKSVGGVSYKADVYNFGMLLMEMAGRRKNVNPFANTSSQIYFPSWIYDKLNQGEDMEMENASEEDRKIVRKMIIVALSCIQMSPAIPPSMSKVIEMLESPNELLHMPPKPFLGSSLERMEDDPTIIELTTTSLQSSSSSNYSMIQSS